MKTITATLLAAGLAVANVAYAGSTGKAGTADGPMKLDTNKDGSLSKEELASSEWASHFDKMDSNQDGQLSQAEINSSAQTKGDANLKGADKTKAP